MPKYFKDEEGVKYLYCEKCDIEHEDRDVYHCDDCQVCMRGFDHHCVFFSKCIAQGNINSFWCTIGMLILNFIIIGGGVLFFGLVDN